MSSRALIVLVAVLSIATVGLGLRVGAGGPIRAAIVTGAPLSHGRGSWQLHVQREAGPLREAVTTPFLVDIRTATGLEHAEGTTNVDGVGEFAFDGEPLDITVTDDRGLVLASGPVRKPNAPLVPVIVEHTGLRPSRLEGALKTQVTIFGGSLVPTQETRVWVALSATGEPPRHPRVEATGDPGIDLGSQFVVSQDPVCHGLGSLGVVAHTHIGGLALHVKDDLGREGEWYGALPIAAGAMRVSLPATTPTPKVRFGIASTSARNVAYVEVDDAEGRADAHVLSLYGEAPHADVTIELRSEGRSFVVVSGEPDGATNVSGGTRAIPIWYGPPERAPCEGDLAEATARSFPRFVALDGFEAKHAAQNDKRRHGRRIATGGLVAGSFVMTLLLLRAARTGQRAPTASKRRLLDVLVVLALSLLGFVLLFALVEWAGH